MATGLFITGTDTDSGKTVATLGLMHRLQLEGERVVGMKPVAAGAEQTAAGLRNDDALQLQAQGSLSLPYEQINPYLFVPPIAPHLAAEQAAVTIDFEHIGACYRQLVAVSDRVLVEGAGGWLVPLGPQGGIAELARSLDLPVILVVGLKLGCINHALLSAAAIVGSGARLAGWIGCRVDPDMLQAEGNIATLRERLGAPCLGIIPHLDSPTAARVSGYLSIPEF